MALILRIDVDRPYGKKPLLRHLLSRISSDLFFPRIDAFGYLKELEEILGVLKKHKARAYVFFRRCTLPSKSALRMIDEGGHVVGLHLDDSRSFTCFSNEKDLLEKHLGRPVMALSKHGSGIEKHGLYHYAPYEPDNYVDWARTSGMKVFMGNLEDPTIGRSVDAEGFWSFPSAFWIEPSWRDTNIFTMDWLMRHAKISDIVLLIHPENVIADPSLLESFELLLSSLESRILE